MTLSVAHIVAGLGRSQGGPSYSVPRLCSAEKGAGASVKLCAVDLAGDPPLPHVEAQLCRHDYSGIPILRSLRASKAMRAYLAEIIPSTSLVHVHGAWLMPNVYAGATAARLNRPLIVSPRGMLAPEALQFSRFRKLAFWKMLLEDAYKHAAVWHATCEAEVEEIRRFGVSQPVAMIPNGVDLPKSVDEQERSSPEFARQNVVLSLGRVHKKKGLNSLVRAWAQVSAAFPDWRLRIVGPDENGHAAELTALAASLGATRLTVEPALFGTDKARALAEASIFVLPTLNENFGIVVAEALGAGMPAIVTKGAPWSGLVDERCGWWIDAGVEPLARALATGMRTPAAELAAMGARGRGWVARDFAWDRIAAEMLAVYRWMVDGGTPPPTVRMK